MQAANAPLLSQHCRRIACAVWATLGEVYLLPVLRARQLLLESTGSHQRTGDDHYNPSHALFRSQEHALMRPLEHLTAASVSPGRHTHGTRHGSLTQLRLPSKPDSFIRAADAARTRGKPYTAATANMM